MTTPAHNIKNEQSVLGSILLDNDIIHDTDLDAQDFYLKAHHKIYVAMQELTAKENPIDVITLMNHLKNKSQLESVGDVAYLTTLSAVPTAANAKYYATHVKNDSKRRSVVSISEVMRGSMAEVDLTIDNALNQLTSLQLVGDNETVAHVSKDLHATVDKFIDPKSENMIPSYLTDLDYSIGGFVNGEHTVIAARTSMGKTAFMLTLAYLQASNGHPVLIFSHEMTREVLTQRMLCFKNKACFQDFRAGRDIEAGSKKIIDAAAAMSDLPIYIDDTPKLTAMEMERRVRKAKRDHGIKIVYIDYLQLMKPTANRNRNREQEVAEISRDLKAMAKTQGVPVNSLAQVNRKVEERVNKRPKMSDIRECGAIEQDADNVIMLYRDEYYNAETNDVGVVEVLIEKFRNGAAGTVKTAFIAESMMFADLQRDYYKYD